MKKIRIALVDDEQSSIDHLRALIRDYMKRLNTKARNLEKDATFQGGLVCQITEYTSGIEMVAAYKKGSYDLVFLDVMMPDRDGFAVAEQLRALDDDQLFIVFATSMEHMVQKGYDYDARAYIYKEVTQKQVDTLLERLLPELSGKSALTNRLTIQGQSYDLDQIYYFCQDGDRVSACFKDKEQSFTFDFEELASSLSERGFLRIHQIYLVNLKYVFEEFGDTLVLTNGNILEIGKSYRKMVKKRLDEAQK